MTELDLYHDDLLAPEQRERMEARLRADAELRAGLEFRRELDQRLRRAFASPAPAALGSLARAAGARSARPVAGATRRIATRWRSLAAAALLVAAIGAAVALGVGGGDVLRADRLLEALQSEVTCTSVPLLADDQLASHFERAHGVPLCVAVEPRAAAAGGATVHGPYRCELWPSATALGVALHEDASARIVLIDRADRGVRIESAGGVHAHRRAIGALVAVELTRDATPRALSLLYPR